MSEIKMLLHVLIQTAISFEIQGFLHIFGDKGLHFAAM